MEFIFRRLITLVITIFVVSILTFTVFQILPGDPALLMLGTEADAEAVSALRAQLGLNGSVWSRYLTWMSGLLRGELGVSFRLGQPVLTLVAERLPLTGALTLLAMTIVAGCSVPLGIYAAVKRGSTVDTIIRSLTQLGLAIPFFWAGIMLILLFSLRLGWLPPGGYIPWSESAVGALKSLLLPAIALALPRIAIFTRLVRASVVEVIGADYIRAARSKGLPEKIILCRHVLRNALIPVVTMFGVHTANLLAGSIIAEEVFALPGLGRLLLAGIGYRDLPLVQGLVLAVALLVLLINFAVDIVYMWLEPRVHYS